MEPLRVFIGYDARESVAFQVLVHSLIARSSVPLSITPVVRRSVSAVYTRPRGPTESTDFSMTRFLVPYLAGYRGTAIFMDCDMLCLDDVANLMARTADNDKAVWVAPHDYEPKTRVKMDGKQQTRYPRKNWSSLMVMDASRCTALTPEYVNSASGVDLHRFTWLKDDQIGRLPLEWNWLVGEYPKNPSASLLHYTLGGPWFTETAQCDNADLWLRERDEMLGKR